ncbi:MAG: class I SAM-dependent methyltransferase [Nitrospirae bacterium]|nr:class I SAM-dependent methyltransferase [Nitrospirota bacterium]
MKHVNCNLCGIDKTRLIAIQNEYKVVQCPDCGLVYVNPRPTTDMLIKLYNDYHQRGGKDEHSWAMLMEGNFKEVSVFLNKLFHERGNLLDIGCAYGHFIEMMKGYGWSVTGIDPSSEAIASARKKDLHVFETTIEDAVFPEASFDAVTAFYILEHLADPLSALKKIFNILKPGGIVVLRIPHTTPVVKFLTFFGIKNNLYDLPYHLYDFSPETIRLLLEKAGFSLISVRPGRPTLPKRYVERLISIVSGNFSRFIFAVSMSKLLLPGTSKTVIATRP